LNPGLLIISLLILSGLGALIWFAALLCWNPLSHYIELRSFNRGMHDDLERPDIFVTHDDDTGNDIPPMPRIHL